MQQRKKMFQWTYNRKRTKFTRGPFILVQGCHSLRLSTRSCFFCLDIGVLEFLVWNPINLGATALRGEEGKSLATPPCHQQSPLPRHPRPLTRHPRWPPPCPSLLLSSPSRLCPPDQWPGPKSPAASAAKFTPLAALAHLPELIPHHYKTLSSTLWGEG